MGDALRAEIDGRADDTTFLAGGWFRPIDDQPISCPLFLPPPQFRFCREGFRLRDARTGPWAISLAINDPPRFDKSIAFTQDRPVVLRLHTHDPGCVDYPSDDPDQCPHLPVLDELVWLGASETEPPTPTVAPTQPTDGLGRAEAVDIAGLEVGRVPGRRVRVVCAEVRLHSQVYESLSPRGTDPWMWVVVFRGGEFDWERVAIQFRTGKFIAGEASGGPSAGPMTC